MPSKSQGLPAERLGKRETPFRWRGARSPSWIRRNGEGLTDGLTSLWLNGAACGAKRGGFECNGGDVFDFFNLSVVPGTLVGGLNPDDLAVSVTTTPVGDDAGRVRGPGRPRLPGLAQNDGGGLSA